MQGIGAQLGSPGLGLGLAGGGVARGGIRRTEIGAFRQTWSRPLGAPGRVELWFVPAGAHRHLARHANVLGAEDWSAIARVREVAARDHLRATRIALRLALSHAVSHALQPQAWRFQTTSYGKPQVASGLPQVHFCVSHIETMSVIAVSRDGPVGVDIETIGPSCNDKVVEAFCSPKERRALLRLAGPTRARAFARLWTLKEAYVKLTGTGLAADTRFLEFRADPEQPAVGYQVQHVPGAASFQSWLTEAPGGLCQVAVAVGDTQAGAERGELVCFTVADSGGHDAQSRTLNPGRGEQAQLSLS